METNSIYSRRAQPLAIVLILIGAASRLIPHVPNFTAVGGIGLFAGARLNGWKAFLIPVLIMATTNPILAYLLGHKVFTSTTWFVYGSLLINVLIGRVLRKSITTGRIAGASLACSVQFYLVTNFGVWLLTSLYPPTVEGLVACYLAGLPYLGSTIAGDFTFSVFLFGSHYLIVKFHRRRAELTASEKPEGLTG
ncbi:MAG TPA: DUF6580 family putative transport protein [Acidobacteriota bacterium]|nr:DUF6580 family putative transport protein [Acidobacteriota bacterium]